MVSFKKISILIEDVCIPMILIFMNMHQMLNFIHYVHILILGFNRSDGNVFYSAVSIFLRCCYHKKKKTHFVTFLQSDFTTTKMFLNDPSMFIVNLEKSTSVWNYRPFMVVRVKEMFIPRKDMYCLNNL